MLKGPRGAVAARTTVAPRGLATKRQHVHGVGDATQPSHPLPPSSPFAFNLSQHQSLSIWIRFPLMLALAVLTSEGLPYPSFLPHLNVSEMFPA